MTLHRHPRPWITEGELEFLLPGTSASRYGKVKRWIAQEKLLHIRRGLYVLTEHLGYLTAPHAFELAQYIYGPSYISLESALSYHHLIPEAVYTVTSVSIKRTKSFETPVGIFSYAHLPTKNFYQYVDRVTENTHTFFIATPWKALCDYIFFYKKRVDKLNNLLEDLRIEREDLPPLSTDEKTLLDDYYHHRQLSRFLKLAKREFPT